MVTAGINKRGRLFNGYRVSIWKNEKVLEMDDGDNHTII